jgi:hypothetical protein
MTLNTKESQISTLNKIYMKIKKNTLLLKQFKEYRRAPVLTDLISAVYRGPLKFGKLNKYTVCKSQSNRQMRVGRNKVKSSSPNSLLVFLCPPYSRFPAELASILLLPFPLFPSVPPLSHCLCSESHYLSIKLYRIYVCYTNITLYIAFGIIRGFT